MQSDNDYVARSYALSSVNGARDLYDEWAASYDKDLAAAKYTSPGYAVDAIIASLGQDSQDVRSFKVLDAGCGTGLVGVLLKQKLVLLSSESEIDGLDLSPGMLERARKTNAYSVLEEADLSKPIARPDCMYDIVACVGTLTRGHVGPDCLLELARVTKPGGLLVVTVNDEIWDSGGYAAALDQLKAGTEANVKVEVLQEQIIGFTQGTSTGGRLLATKKV